MLINAQPFIRSICGEVCCLQAKEGEQPQHVETIMCHRGLDALVYECKDSGASQTYGRVAKKGARRVAGRCRIGVRRRVLNWRAWGCPQTGTRNRYGERATRAWLRMEA